MPTLTDLHAWQLFWERPSVNQNTKTSSTEFFSFRPVTALILPYARELQLPYIHAESYSFRISLCFSVQ